MLGTKKEIHYLGIKDGKIVSKPDGQRFDFFSGRLTGIYLFQPKVANYGPVYHFRFEDESGEQYTLSSGQSSGISKALINSLATADDFRLIKIETEMGNGFTKVKAFSNETFLKWRYTFAELPAVEKKTIGGREISDDSAQMEKFSELVSEINEKLGVKTENHSGGTILEPPKEAGGKVFKIANGHEYRPEMGSDDNPF